MTTVRGGRAILNALAGLLLAGVGLGVLGGLLVISGAAALSLVTGPGDWAHGLLYAVALPVVLGVLLWTSQGLADAQRARVHVLLRVTIARPGTGNPWWPWRSAATWRALGYHMVAVFVAVLGYGTALGFLLTPAGAAVWILAGHHSPLWFMYAVSITLPFVLFAAPQTARSVGGWDAAIARALLGPSRGDELAQQVQSLSRSRAEIVEATDTERRRIERDLHDGAQQRLVSLAMNLGIARATITDAPEPARRAIAEAHDEAVLALAEMRAFIRGLHPAVLNDRGLDAALSGLVAHAPMPVRLTVDVPSRTSASVEAVAYFIVSEALANVAKHAEATRAEVTVARAGDRLRIVVADDGRGGAAETGEGTGLRGLAQRAASVDGTLTVHSPTGGPTTVTAELPCES